MSSDVPVDPLSVTPAPVTGTDSHAWERVDPWADRLITGVCALAVVIAAFDDRPISRTVPWGVALVVAIAAATTTLDRVLGPAPIDAVADSPGDLRYLRWWAPVLAVLGSLWLLAVLTSPSYFIAVFGLYWLFWSTVDLPWATVPAAVLTLAFVVANHHWGSSWVEALAQGAISFGMGFLFALYIRSLVDQSRQRKALIDELRAAQEHLAVAQREAGVLAERERLAREIHDTLAQGFTSIVMLSQAGRFERIEEVARENLAEARRLVAALQPAVLDGRTLGDALARFVRSFRDDTGLEATLEVAGDPRALSRSEEVALVRTAQEALANVRQHADATTVRIRLSYGDVVTMSVVDDGRGFDPSATRTGFGLRGLGDRAAEVHADLVVRSAPGSGTSVEVRVP